jgi:hypothetical protein
VCSAETWGSNAVTRRPFKPILHIAYSPAVDSWVDGMTAGFSLPAAGRAAKPDHERIAIAGECDRFHLGRPALLDACCPAASDLVPCTPAKPKDTRRQRAD